MEQKEKYDEIEFESLYKRLLLQKGNAFFCVTVNHAPLHCTIAGDMRDRFPLNAVQIIDFKELKNYRFSSASLQKLLNEDAKIVFLANFQLACGDMPDVDFFQMLNLSRDALAELPVVFVFMTPLYFRIQIARNAPDFNSFFQYRADFKTDEGLDVREYKIDTTEYNETSRELLKYYEEKWSTLTDFESKQAFETLLKILSLNSSARVLTSIESKRFYEAFLRLLPMYEDESGISPDDIAEVYESQGEYARALEWYEKALVICEKVLGNEHPDTAKTYNNIALVYSRQGDYDSALELYEKSLAIKERVLDKEHPSTAATYNNIAGVYDSQGDYARALEWYEKALAIREKILGKEHPDTSTTYNNIAFVYDNQGDYTRALEWYEKALAICEKVLGKEHPSTAATYNNIAGVYDSQGDFARALEWNEKALAIREKVLGKEHPSTATTYNNIAVVYDNQGEYARALEWYEKALAIYEKVFGCEHPDTKTVRANIEITKEKQNSSSD